MERRIDLLDTPHMTRVLGRAGDRRIQVGEDSPQPAVLTRGSGFDAMVQVGEDQARIRLAVKGEKTFIRAFGRTLTLTIVDPVEQASQAAGGQRDTALAPMPGTLVECHVAPGDPVERSQPLVTIESMKILTLIQAPRQGVVEEICFQAGETFDKNAVLVRLAPKAEDN